MALSLELGLVVTTPGAIEACHSGVRMKYLTRHQQGDWGTVGKEAWAFNDEAAKRGGRVLSVYPLKEGLDLWIITEENRASTTILLSSEY